MHDSSLSWRLKVAYPFTWEEEATRIVVLSSSLCTNNNNHNVYQSSPKMTRAGLLSSPLYRVCRRRASLMLHTNCYGSARRWVRKEEERKVIKLERYVRVTSIDEDDGSKRGGKGGEDEWQDLTTTVPNAILSTGWRGLLHAVRLRRATALLTTMTPKLLGPTTNLPRRQKTQARLLIEQVGYVKSHVLVCGVRGVCVFTRFNATLPARRTCTRQKQTGWLRIAAAAEYTLP